MSGFLLPEGLAHNVRAFAACMGYAAPQAWRTSWPGLIGAWHRPRLRCAGQPVLVTSIGKATWSMVVLGIDAHKRTHTVVAVDEAGRQLGVRVTQATSTAAHL